MSHHFDHIPLNAQIVARYGDKSVFKLRDGSLLTVDQKTQETFVNQFSYSGQATDGHNSAWADHRIMDYALNKRSKTKPTNKAVGSKQSARKPDPKEQQLDEDPRANFIRLLPKEFTEWARNYKQGDPLPSHPPGYRPLHMCTGMSRADVSGTNEGISTDRLVGTVLAAMGLPDKNPMAEQKKNKNDIRKKGLLGREIRDMGENIQDSILSARGLWRDKLNKIRCGPGTAAANRFTDAFGTGCDIPGPVDEAASSARRTAGRATEAAGDATRSAGKATGRADQAQERAERTTDGAKRSGGRIGEWLGSSRPAAGYATAKVTIDDPDRSYDPYEPVASMRSDTNGRFSSRFREMITVSLANKNERKQRAKQKKREAEAARESYSNFAENYKMRFELENGYPPPQAQVYSEWARSLGIDVPADGGIFGLESDNWVEQRIGDIPMGPRRLSPTDTNRYDAMIDEALNDERLAGFIDDYERTTTRNTIKENLDNMIQQMIWQMRGAGGDASPDNPEHGTRIASSVPGYLRIGNENDGPNAKDLIYTSVNSFFGGDPLDLEGRGLTPMSKIKENGAPGWVAEGLTMQSVTGEGMPFHYSISLNPQLLAGKGRLREVMNEMGSDHLGMDLDKDGDAFLAHTASHEIAHVDDFAWRLGQKLGFTDEQEWKDRLSKQYRRQALNPDGSPAFNADGSPMMEGMGPIDLRTDAKEGTFLRREIDALDLVLGSDTATEIDKQDALWQFYMKTVRFDGNVAQEYARWMRSSGISKAGSEVKLQEIMQNLESRGYSEENGFPQLEFWQDMVDTPTGIFDPATGTFGPAEPRNVGVDPTTGATPLPMDGGARLENAASSMLMSFIGGMYSTESDWEFMAELRTRLSTPGALSDIRAFLADDERNIYGLTESQFMTFLAKVVGQDEVMRLRGGGRRRGGGAGAVGGRRVIDVSAVDDG